MPEYRNQETAPIRSPRPRAKVGNVVTAAHDEWRKIQEKSAKEGTSTS